MSRKSQHVVPKGLSWAVRSSGSSRSTKVYATQREAIQAARRIARNQESELVIHGRDGRIREEATAAIRFRREVDADTQGGACAG